MRLYLISDNVDTLMGFRLAGIEGDVVDNQAHFQDALNTALNDERVGILMLTSIVYDYDRENINQLKLTRSLPLIIEISDRHQSYDVSAMIQETLKKITGGGV